jgi:hypothetical protein
LNDQRRYSRGLGEDSVKEGEKFLILLFLPLYHLASTALSVSSILAIFLHTPRSFSYRFVITTFYFIALLFLRAPSFHSPHPSSPPASSLSTASYSSSPKFFAIYILLHLPPLSLSSSSA